ncbi:MAG TPA: alanine racemase, partial [Gemmatimonadales bacterium]|nr:alanine racemase [Gemmatimonadales bacterium]
MTTASPCDTTRAWVDVDLSALTANAKTVTAVSGGRLLPMVKANGYGLGAIPVSQALEALAPWGYGVATLDEGAELRRAGITRPILLCTPLLADWIDRCLELDLRPSIGDLSALERWTTRTQRPFHIEIDTGMARSGFRYDDPALRDAVGRRLAKAEGWEGAFTHFHSPETDRVATELQWARFQEVLSALPRRPALLHAANSAAALNGTRYTADLVRPGIFLYGGAAGGPAPAPVVAFRARVVGVRRIREGDTVSYGASWRADAPARIATIAAGYADGFPRAAGRGRAVELCGRVVPVVGRVAMDMIMVAIDEDHRVELGDLATL